MKKKRTAQSAFLSLCILVGLLVFFTGTLFTLFAASPTAWTSRGEAKPPALTQPAAGIIDGEVVAGHAEGGPCQYTITYRTDPIAPGNTDTGNHCAWCDTTINLPFPFVLYDQTSTL